VANVYLLKKGSLAPMVTVNLNQNKGKADTSVVLFRDKVIAAALHEGYERVTLKLQPLRSPPNQRIDTRVSCSVVFTSDLFGALVDVKCGITRGLSDSNGTFVVYHDGPVSEVEFDAAATEIVRQITQVYTKAIKALVSEK